KSSPFFFFFSKCLPDSNNSRTDGTFICAARFFLPKAKTIRPIDPIGSIGFPDFVRQFKFFSFFLRQYRP
ncbi:MAG TPA: hypothetical protein PKW49_13715, partial [Paludibacteraceae bacterium]|nr:hypothetical protein [Paludibacteraceae bacterium]HOU69609.1 hypothetical protein [Paludibacteraceae bacterium]HQF51257.1 hypothetical protein [Paludibacteraceae bacterium]